MRILIDYRPALRQRTGVGEYAHELAAALAGHLQPPDALTLFSSSWKDRLEPGAIPDVAIVDARVPVTLLNLAWHRLEWPPIESFAGAIDVAHSMHPLLMPARRAAQVVTIYDLYFLDQPDDTAAEIRRDYPLLAGAHARRADAIVTISKYTAAKIQATFGVPLERIAICPPGAPDWPPLPAPRATGPILFVGTIEPRKNVAGLLRAYEALVARKADAPDLMLAGKVAPACEPLVAAIAASPVAPRVRLVGYVNGADRERIYREASMLVVPSFDEGFGMTAVEAMSIGLPVIAANRGALPEVVGDAGLLIDPDDPAAIAEAMLTVLAGEGCARERSARGVARARQFSWRTSAGRLADTYAAALERRRARG